MQPLSAAHRAGARTSAGSRTRVVRSEAAMKVWWFCVAARLRETRAPTHVHIEGALTARATPEPQSCMLPCFAVCAVVLRMQGWTSDAPHSVTSAAQPTKLIEVEMYSCTQAWSCDTTSLLPSARAKRAHPAHTLCAGRNHGRGRPHRWPGGEEAPGGWRRQVQRRAHRAQRRQRRKG